MREDWEDLGKGKKRCQYDVREVGGSIEWEKGRRDQCQPAMEGGVGEGGQDGGEGGGGDGRHWGDWCQPMVDGAGGGGEEGGWRGLGRRESRRQGSLSEAIVSLFDATVGSIFSELE